MKNLSLLAINIFLLIASVTAQLKVHSNGNVGIGQTSPAYKLDVEGAGLRFSNWTDVYLDWSAGQCCGVPTLYPERNNYLQIGLATRNISLLFASRIICPWISFTSDDSIKTNVSTITDAISKVQQLTGKEFYFRTSFTDSMPDSLKADLEGRKQYGFMARQVNTIMPELVSYESTSGLYSMNYIGVIPILNEAVKEQQAIINDQQNEIDVQQAQIDALIESVLALETQLEYQNTLIEDLTATTSTLSATIDNCCPGAGFIQKKNIKGEIINSNDSKLKNEFINKENPNFPTLYQNNPNPFNEKTEISYYLPRGTINANIIIYNLNGEQIKRLECNGDGRATIAINANELAPGSYYYTLIVNGKEIDTKKMILIK